MPEVRIPTNLRKLTGDRSIVHVDGRTVAETLANLETQFPGLRDRLLHDGEVRRFVNIYVGEEDIRFRKGLATSVEADTSVSIIPAVAGGALRTETFLRVGKARMKSLRVGLLGCGTVGTPVAKALLEDGESLRRAARIPIELTRVAVRHPDRRRTVDLPPDIVTTDALAVAIDPDIDIVIEVIGGVEPALTSIKAALEDDKAVITANKELLVGAGASLLDDPERDLYFEAAACGVIPIVRTLKEHCAADRVQGFTGIFSGTCNFILSTMTRRRCSLDEALSRARFLGYTEHDPRADIEGSDAAAKVALLARVAFGVPVAVDEVDRIGVTDIDRTLIAAADAEGLVYKLVGGARRVGSEIEAWVRPNLVRLDDPLAGIGGPDNSITIKMARGGILTFHGAGAGGNPTATAVLADLLAVAKQRRRDRGCYPCTA